MDQIARIVPLKPMATGGESVQIPALGEFFAREQEQDIVLLIPDGHAVRKGALRARPPAPKPKPVVNESTGPWKRLVAQPSDHRVQQKLVLPRLACSNNSGNSRHAINPL